MSPRPKTGERRQVRQPLKIDKLPQPMRDEILRLRAENGLTWEQIEECSPGLVGWETVSPAIAELFPGQKIPHTTLHRWYDLRVAQAQQELLAETAQARELAKAFADRGFEKLPEAVLNALRDQVFIMLRAMDDKNRDKFTKALSDFGWLVAQFRKVEIAQQKVDVEVKRVAVLEQENARRQSAFEKQTRDAASKLEKGKALTIDDINRLRERTFGLPPIEREASGSPAA